MIFGLNPHGFELSYYIMNLVCRLVAYIFFRKVHLVGLENLPKTGPVVLCGTHNN